MFDRLKAWLSEEQGEPSGGRDELPLAVAALLIEAARIDDTFDARERAVVHALLARRFSLNGDQAEALIEVAARRQAGSSQLFGFTRIISERFPPERRREVVEMLWEVAYADGVLDPLEDSLLRRVAGLIEVSDYERGEARINVMRRLGLGEQN